MWTTHFILLLLDVTVVGKATPTTRKDKAFASSAVAHNVHNASLYINQSINTDLVFYFQYQVTNTVSFAFIFPHLASIIMVVSRHGYAHINSSDSLSQLTGQLTMRGGSDM